MPRRILSLVALALAGVLLAACGGSSDEGSPLDQVKADGVLKIGTEGTYSPFTFHAQDTNELTGYDVEVITAVAKKLGVKPEFSESTFDAIFAGLTSERWDVVANQVTRTPEREKLYDLSQTYTVSEGVILVKKGDTAITSLDDLKGRTTAQSSTSNWAQVAKDAGAKVESVEGFVQAVTLVKQGRVDAIVNDNLAVLDYLKNSGDTSVEVAAKTGDTSDQVFAFRKDSGLVGPVNDALDELRADGTLAKISEKYFGSDVSK
ncbi:amino acid ABC transporter substrate-binding protein [Solicola sp. PLA-1-18]|uniref:amino acid ABC transporter substrate-binding protein n=1 Tax=Solicola sp. PLA-1-18 TaxID=3380532 RepID=UPI003B7E24DE